MFFWGFPKIVTFCYFLTFWGGPKNDPPTILQIWGGKKRRVCGFVESARYKGLLEMVSVIIYTVWGLVGSCKSGADLS